MADINSTESSELLKRFNTMTSNVIKLIQTEGATYSTWIKFKLGKNDPVIFDSTSTDSNQNLIASLEMKKASSGMANDFTLTVHYDPFKYGQVTQTESSMVEHLDNYIAEKLNSQWNDDLESFTGTISYGYNTTGVDDLKLSTPEYEFMITDAKSDTNFATGITTYTFQGVSQIACDCNFQAQFSEVKNWKPLDLVVWILYYYYGNEQWKPNGIRKTDKPCDTALGYKIDVPMSLLNDQIDEIPVIPADSGKTPWQYCMSILEKYPLTKSEQDSGKYDDLSNVDTNKQPRYFMYITDDKDMKTIHIEHITPEDPSRNMQIAHPFTWGNEDRNLIVGWKPELDLRYYLIQRFSYDRAQEQLKKGGIDINSVSEDTIKEQYRKDYETVKQGSITFIDAHLELLGIPSDPPLTAEVIVKPRVLETVSRTAGVFEITGCTDKISTNGTYTTTLDLFRIRQINESTINIDDEVAKNKLATEQNKNFKGNYSSTSGDGGGFSSGSGYGYGGSSGGGR